MQMIAVFPSIERNEVVVGNKKKNQKEKKNCFMRLCSKAPKYYLEIGLFLTYAYILIAFILDTQCEHFISFPFISILFLADDLISPHLHIHSWFEYF